MTVPSWQFLVFACAAACVFNLRGAASWRSLVLLLTNLLFLLSFTSDPAALLPFGGFLLAGYLLQGLVRGGRFSRGFALVVIAIILLFAWLKRYSFFPQDSLLPFPYLQVGLSYVFFRVLHLVTDSHQDAVEEPVSVLSYLNYTLNFTSLVSGPIQRYQDYREAEIRPLPLDAGAVGFALERFVVGFCKVSILSLLLSEWQHRVIADLSHQTTIWGQAVSAALIVAIYPVYLFCNFSGYTDAVIGVARLFGLRLPENFDRPFSSPNFIVFWARWHITLSTWLKTYVYNPLMMAFMGRIKSPSLAPFLSVIAFFITFFLVGIWHGQSSELAFFGLLQGGGVAFNKLYQVEMGRRLGRLRYRELAANSTYIIACRGLTFCWFAFTLLWFWSSWAEIGSLASLVAAPALILAFGLTWFTAAIFLALWERLRTLVLAVRLPYSGAVGPALVNSHYLRTSWVTAVAVITLLLFVVLNAPAPEIVYKAF